MLNDNRWRFLLLWVIPGVFIQLLIHIASPGHTLFATPVWCVMGAFVIYQVGKHRETVLALAVGISAALFLNVIPPGYPPSATASSLDRAWISLKNSVAYGTFETSLERLRWWDEMTDVSINELSRLSAPDRPTMTVILHGTDIEFDFVSWRVVSYYLKDRPFWVLMDNLPPEAPGRVRLVQGMDVQTLHESSIRIPESGRVLWVMLPNGRFHRALEKIMPVHAGRYIFYTDGPYTRAFNIEGFDFISESSAMDRTK
jgi:hypothetical protein